MSRCYSPFGAENQGTARIDIPIYIESLPRSIGVVVKSYTKRASTTTVYRFCTKRLRHTFARVMADASAKVSDIQARLGHASLSTTGRYLAALNRADNEHAESIAARLGLDL